MYGAVLTEPVEPGSHAGVLFMHTEGFSTMCGHGVIAIVTVALERGLLHVSDPSGEIVLDTPAGTVRATAERRDDRVTRVSFVNVPSFVLSAGVAVRIGSRDLRVDIAYGGAFYAIVDTETAGVPLRSSVAYFTLMVVSHPEPGLQGTIYPEGNLVFPGPEYVLGGVAWERTIDD